ncbi:uncharacterized protein HD556DRAFT_1435872 [Suillus plorans]|uniref:Uncharacterized protein n=1 Tax=Suillus plorans TaxID=116603 RepID=A0A9P7J9V0_9AGAM|nr:uncharacterized protein HD556DRAFT_1435872 [Suillus plorans]KAG1810156.1 hypothetical protein HD556DRAFT_1435872 [Suillus plorans]
MPNTSTALSFGPVDCSDKVDVTGKVGVAGNHIFMDVETCSVDWPTYTIKFTPTHPGPVTLILHLKDASRFKYVEDEDSDMETSESKACKISSSSTKDDLDATFVSKETTSKTDDNPNLFIATPVRLDAIRKDFSSKKRKLGHGHFFGDADSAWPPRWPRGYRNVSSLPISAFESLKITPADVVAIDKITYTLSRFHFVTLSFHFASDTDTLCTSYPIVPCTTNIRIQVVFLVHPRARYVSKASKICLSTNLIHQRAVERERSQEASQNAQPGTIKRMQFTFSIDAPPAHSLQLHLYPTPSLAKAPPPPSQTSSLALSSEKVAGAGEVTDPLSLTMLLPTPHPTRTVFLISSTLPPPYLTP